MRKLTLVLAVAVVALAGCKDKNNPVKAAEETAKEKDLQHTFQSECQVKPLDTVLTGILTGGKSTIKSSRTLYRFEGNRVTRTTQMFGSSDCSAESAGFIETGTFEINKDIKTSDGGKGIKLKFDKLTVKVASDDGAKIANGMSLCGISDWKPGDEREVTGSSENLTCYSAQVPRTDENIYRVDAGKLMLGSSSTDPKSSSERPDSLDKTNTYQQK